MEIKKSYLMWVGSESYKTIDDWSGEAVVQGISKRLPTAFVGQKLTEDGAVIFVAHDEGESHDCEECAGTLENPEKRKLKSAWEKLDKEISDIEAKIAKATDGAKLTDEALKEVSSLEKLRSRRIRKRIAAVEGYQDEDDEIESGTGGWTKVKTADGVECWDYRKYNYWLHQPKKFDPDAVVEKEMCECCGGTGLLPNSKVFGIFVPSAVEYIMKKEDGDEVRRRMERQGIRVVTQGQLVTEKTRKCGKRCAGGVYVVTDTGNKPTYKATELVETLIRKGIVEPDGVDIKGNFIRFVEPVGTDVKRFRGIKTWCLDPAAEDEAEMILDAISAE